MIYRRAEISEIEDLSNIRKKQLIDEGIEPNVDIDEELREFFYKKMKDGSLIEWVVEDNGELVATAAIVFYEFPPSYTNKSGKKGYVTNVYTRDEYRGQGIATNLLNKLVEEAKVAGVSKLWLGASKLGKPVYKRFGFVENDSWLELNI